MENENMRKRITRDAGFKSLIELTIFCIKSLISINGGAIIVLLAFIGNMVSKGIDYPTGMSCALLWYFLGVAAAILQLMFVYAFQVFEIEGGTRFPRIHLKREWLRYTAVVLAVMSICFFILGSMKAVCTFEKISVCSRTGKYDSN